MERAEEECPEPVEVEVEGVFLEPLEEAAVAVAVEECFRSSVAAAAEAEEEAEEGKFPGMEIQLKVKVVRPAEMEVWLETQEREGLGEVEAVVLACQLHSL